jgi:predicted TPR repeat methyltransferase
MVTSSAPLFVSSGDLVADQRYRWAIDHARRGDLAGAADILVRTVQLAPAFATAWFALGAIRDVLGDRAGAIAAFAAARDADPQDYHGARLFAFTVESHDGPDVVLRETLRYAHSADHVRDALERAGLNLLALDPASKRTEKGAPISGLVVVARSGG